MIVLEGVVAFEVNLVKGEHDEIVDIDFIAAVKDTKRETCFHLGPFFLLVTSISIFNTKIPSRLGCWEARKV